MGGADTEGRGTMLDELKEILKATKKCMRPDTLVGSYMKQAIKLLNEREIEQKKNIKAWQGIIRHWQNKAKESQAEVDRLGSVVASWQAKYVEYVRCPKCSQLVAMTGVDCLTGNCTGCGETVVESEMGEPVDPTQLARTLPEGHVAVSREIIGELLHMLYRFEGDTPIENTSVFAMRDKLQAILKEAEDVQG